MRASRLLGFSPLLLALGAGAMAQAGDDGLQLSTGLGWHHDDNLLRLADNVPGAGGQRGDSWRQVDAGAAFDHLYSRQRLQASVQLSQVHFNHFSQLNYDGKDARATWSWQLGNQFDGHLGVSHVTVLAPYTDLRSSERNLRVQHQQFFDAAWRPHPRWRLHAGYTENRYGYELLAQRPNNRSEQARDGSIDYLAPSGSEVGLVLRRLDGRYPYRRPFALATDDFDQLEYRLRVNWIASAKTSINLLAGWTTRRQDVDGPGRSSGLTGRVAAAWSPTVKLGIDGALWRDFAPIESSVVSTTLNHGASLTAAWRARAKLRLGASVLAERREYGSRRALPLLAGPPDLNDSLRTAGLNLAYTPSRTVKIGASIERQVRGGSRVLGIGAFRSTAVGINASMAF